MGGAFFLQDFREEEEARELVEAGELVLEFHGLLPLEDLVGVVVALVVQSHTLWISLIQSLHIEIHQFLSYQVSFTIKIFH